MGVGFETHGAVDAGDVLFCVIIVCLSIISLIIFSAMEDEPGCCRKHHRKGRGPLFIGDDTSCGGPICRTYLS